MQYNKDDIEIGERLRSIRDGMHMTREEFSEKIDITDSFLGQIERGERALSVRTLKKVVKYTGVSADYLLFSKDSNNGIVEKITNILSLNSDVTSDFIYNVILCSNDFCNKITENVK
ncbi:MAG: helix-turn-helix transcriptional regulator [Clostridia bacterium]|jgi:transcriptional regulator with XRE-family HTH domain|nr:helix-turn-helix transcriptional regulator [Clostridia bacterium]